MNGEAIQHATLLQKPMREEVASGDDDLALAQAKQKPVGSEGPERKKIKLASIQNDRRSLHSPPKQGMANVSGKFSPHKPYFNSTMKRDPHQTLTKQSPLNRSQNAENVALKKEPVTPIKQVQSASSQLESDDDVPLIARAQHKPAAANAKGSSAKPAKSALNSVVAEKNKVVKPKKSEKMKDGKSLKAERKVDKKVDGVKKKDAKKEKKSASEKAAKKQVDSDDDDEPLSAKLGTPKDNKSAKSSGSSGTKSKGSASLKRKKSADSGSDSDDDYKPLVKTAKKSTPKIAKKEDKGGSIKKKVKKDAKDKKEEDKAKEKGKKKKEEEKEVWKWWEEEQLPDGVKWLHLEHKGPYFPPLYEQLPSDVKFYYDGNHMKLSLAAEEVASYYAKMLDHDYTSKEIFNKNFFEDWRKEMTNEERKIIKDLKKCNFKEMHSYFVKKNEERKNWTKEQKQVLKEQNEAILEEYGYCLMDGHRQRVGNFKIEPPGLFRGRGDHPKQGKFKRRTMPEDVIINIGEGAKVPEPPEGHKWQNVINDNKVSWLACWVENIQGSYKYVMLNSTSRLKGEKDWQKYETARKLKDCVEKIREDYQRDWKAKEMRLRQRGVALYFIDKLALRAGHEKDEETADTVGCCSLRFEHIKLHDEWEDKENVVEFDFLGKDSVRYWNFVPVEKKVFKNLAIFMKGKQNGDDLFDRLSTTSLNKYLSELMDGLTAKVFRTFNASMTLQDQLNKLTEAEDNVNAKVLAYNRANRAVAILCNHQRTVPKTFEKSMSNLQEKIATKKQAIKDGKKELKVLKNHAKESQDTKVMKQLDKKKTQVQKLEDQLFKLEVTATDKEENKEIALGTSKLNYLDPRISVAWCKKHGVPIEKVYNKTQREKFAWALDMAEKDFVF